jgi:hypothetical protein
MRSQEGATRSYYVNTLSTHVLTGATFWLPRAGALGSERGKTLDPRP